MPPQNFEWAQQPFREFLALFKQQANLLLVSKFGISIVRAAPEISSAMATHLNPQLLQNADRLAKVASEEIERDFPGLHAQDAVLTWVGLECMLKTFLAAWLRHIPSARQVQEVRTAKLPVLDFVSPGSEEDRYRMIADLLDLECGAVAHLGLDRFERLLEPFRLSGRADESIRNGLLELDLLRRCLMFNQGRADARLTQTFSHWRTKPGDQLVVGYDQFKPLGDAAVNYTALLLSRVNSAVADLASR